MANVFDEVRIDGLRLTHFEQLLVCIEDREESGYYYGNRDQYLKRHKEIKEWVQGIINKASEPDVIIPKRKEK